MMAGALLLWLAAGAPAMLSFARRGRWGLGFAVLPFAGWLALTMPWIFSALTGASAAGWCWQSLVSGVLVAGVLEGLLRGTEPWRPPPLTPLERLAAAAAILVLLVSAAAHASLGVRALVWAPGFGWDGIILWITRAKMLADVPAAYTRDLLGDQARIHWDYPLLLPAWLGWLRRVGGLGLDALPVGIGLSAAVVPLAGAAVLLQRGNPLLTTATVLSVFALPLTLHYHYRAYADPLLVLTHTTGFLWAATAVRDRDTPLLVAAGIVLAVVVALKNEGTLWLIADTAAIALYALTLHRSWTDVIAACARLCALGLAFFVSWHAACTHLGVSNYLLQATRWELVWSRAPVIATALSSQLLRWHHAVLLVPALALLVVGIGGGRRRSWLAAAALLTGPALYLVGLGVVYGTTPLNAELQLLTSADRVTWGVVPLVLGIPLLVVPRATGGS
jgi:hypothetical protein